MDLARSESTPSHRESPDCGSGPDTGQKGWSGDWGTKPLEGGGFSVRGLEAFGVCLALT